MPKKLSIEPNNEDLFSIARNEWFNDVIIDRYFHYIERYALLLNKKIFSFNTHYFYLLKKHKYDLMCDYCTYENLSASDLVFIPVHRVNHFSLLCFEVESGTVEYFDSGGYKDDISDVFIKFITKIICNENIKKRSFKKIQKNVPRQPNTFDCGLMICLYARHRIEIKEVKFRIDNLHFSRLKLMYELLNEEILFEI